MTPERRSAPEEPESEEEEVEIPKRNSRKPKGRLSLDGPKINVIKLFP
jgi:hypothetical protein